MSWRTVGPLLGLLLCLSPAVGVTLWSDPGATLVFDNGVGRDILGGAVKRDDSSNDTLYFRFHVDPQSDSTAEEYFAAFELYEGDAERLGIGNALKAWAYSAFFKQAGMEEGGPAPGYVDLHSSVLEPSGSGALPNCELPQRGMERTLVFKVQYVAAGDDLVTVWLNPDLSSGAAEVHQSESLTTRFNANASFDEVRLRHGAGGGGWIFSSLAIASSFADFVDTSSAKPVGDAPENGFVAQRLSFQSWQRETGMPRNAIHALAQSPDGHLWLADEANLARFDGVRFVAVDLGRVTRGNRVRVLLSDSRGALWIGTGGGGLVRYAKDGVACYTASDGLPTNSITALAEDAGGRLWIGTECGLRVWQEGQMAQVPGAEVLRECEITALCRDGAGTMWIGAARVGVFRYAAGALTLVSDAAMDSLLRQAHCLLADRSGRVWVGAGDDSVVCMDSNQWRRFRIPGHTAVPYITALAEQPDGTVWAGSASEGLFQFRQGRLTAINAGAGLPDHRVTALFVDREGSLWLGSDSGLSRLRRDHLFALGQNEGLGFGAVQGLAEVAPGVVWAIKPNDGLYRWEGRAFSRLTAAGLTVGEARPGPMLVTRDGSCWIATTNGLLLFRDPQAVADESRLLSLSNVTFTALAEDAEGGIWAGSRQGEVWRLARGCWSRGPQFACTNGITALVSEPGGAMWVGTEGAGLFRWQPSRLVHFSRSNGLLSDVVRTLHRDATGDLWIGTEGGGLARWRDGQLATFSTEHGLPENSVLQILEDDAGRLWLGGSHGIAVVSKQDFDARLPRKLNPVFPSLHGRPDRLPSEGCATGFFPSGLKTRAGLLWFSTLKGVVVADPRHLTIPTTRPQVMLQEVLVDGVPVRVSPGVVPVAESVLRIQPGRHRIELHYTAVDFALPERVRFRYQLAGLDGDWVEAGPRRTAFYNYVPPGEYRFRVAASNGGDPENESQAELALVVSRHFWQRGWVMGLGTLGLLGSVAGMVRFVEKRKAQGRMKRLEQERALEQERRRIAQDLHDEMGAKLCRISFLSEHAQRNDHAQGEVREQINTIADASRELLHTLDEIVWAVNPQNDTLEHLASYINQYAQNYFHNTGVDCELEMPDQFAELPISSQARHHLFLAVHEAFTNILKHSGATRARLAMSCCVSRFEIRVEDNGRGFDPANRPEGGDGDGLRNMQHRLESVGGECRVQTAPGRGTIIQLVLPLAGSKEGQVKS